MCRSVPQMLAVSTSTSTSSAAGAGTGISSSRRPFSGATLRSASMVSDTRESCRAGYGVCVRGLTDNRRALFGAVGIVAVGIAVALILISVLGNGGKKAEPTTSALPAAPAPTSGTDTTPAAPARVPGAAATQKLFRGIPQTLNVFGDLQCPFCREYAIKALPAIVDEYVRPGKLKLVFTGLAFIGPDSEAALRATYAAGLQGKLWNYLDLLYPSQGAESSGWVTDGLFRAVANSIPGLDTSALMLARSSAEVDNAIAVSTQQAQNASVD